MIRDKYDWADAARVAGGSSSSTPGAGGDLRDHEALPSFMVADFRRLFDFRGAGERKHVRPLNVAKRIDTRLVSGLAELPPGALRREARAAASPAAGEPRLPQPAQARVR